MSRSADGHDEAGEAEDGPGGHSSAAAIAAEDEGDGAPGVIDWSAHRITPFQRRVFEALMRVPAGKVTTYKALGEAVGCGSGQAIGQAMKRNPFAPAVP